MIIIMRSLKNNTGGIENVAKVLHQDQEAA